jgi:inward rectifier potassium channel
MRLPGWQRRDRWRRAFGLHEARSAAVRVGYRGHVFHDAYHFLLVSPWWALLSLLVGGFVAVNAAFAVAYLAVPGSIGGARPGSLADAFFFSVQTLSTVGYGTLQPQGLFANALAALEAFLGMLGFATLAGVVFARLSRPTARVMFAHQAVLGRFEGQPALMVRMANARNNQVFDAHAHLAILRDEVTRDGVAMRRFYDLPLLRSRAPVFTLTWTAVHLIDPASPLHGMDAAALEALHAQIMVTLQGIDQTFAQPIHTRRVYRPHEVAWNARYVDVLDRTPDGRDRIDFAHFHDVEPLAGPGPEPRRGS